MEGFVSKQAQEGMPPYISLLFRARRPIEPLRALHKPVYENRPLQPLLDQPHTLGTKDGLLGHVEKEQGEAWLDAVFEDPKTNEAAERKLTESKAEVRRRV